jgi:type IX secretion system substrate protein
MKFTINCALFLAFITTFSMNATAYGIPIDSNEYYLRIIEIGHFNDDAVKDTLVGAAGDNLNFKPRFIYWGNDTNSTIPDSLKLEHLEINFPDNWIKTYIASNIDYLNNDTILDVGMFIAGRFVDTNIVVGDSLRDTVIKVILFGQRGLDTIPYVNVMEIDSFQVSPFVAMQMRYGHELINPMYRELRETISYEFKTIILDLEEETILPPPIVQTNIELELDKYNINFYPNPVNDNATLELSGLDIGEYDFKIYDEIASVVFQRPIKINSLSNFSQQFSLKELSSGKYYLFIEGNNRKIGPIQFVIVK